MEALRQPRFTKRYGIVADEKAGGATYTPKLLADFVAKHIVSVVGALPCSRPLRILDPAVGHGELLIRLLEQLPQEARDAAVEVYGFETDPSAMAITEDRLARQFPNVSIHFKDLNFLEFVIEQFGVGDADLFQEAIPDAYDLIIANPPYVRTQILGASQAQLLAEQFGLAGRVDLYHAFILEMSQVLRPNGIAGIIVSNRFMTIKSETSVRNALFDRFNIRHAWDLGDTKLFDVAVLPAVLLVEGRNGHRSATPALTSIYQTGETGSNTASDPISALELDGVVAVSDG